MHAPLDCMNSTTSLGNLVSQATLPLSPKPGCPGHEQTGLYPFSAKELTKSLIKGSTSSKNMPSANSTWLGLLSIFTYLRSVSNVGKPFPSYLISLFIIFGNLGPCTKLCSKSYTPY